MASSGSGSSRAIRAGKAFVEIGVLNRVGDGLKVVQAQLRDFGNRMTLAGAGVAGLGTAALAGFGALASSVVERGERLLDFSRRFGGTVEDAARLEVAAELAGLKLDDVSNALENIPEKLADAAQGAAEAQQAFRQLGIDPQKLREFGDAKAKVLELVRATDGLNPNDRGGILGKLLGDDGAAKMMALAKGGIADLEARLKVADRVGRVFTTADALQAEAKAREFRILEQSLYGVADAIGKAFLPSSETLQNFSQSVQRATVRLSKFISDNRELVIGAAIASAGLIAFGGAMAAVGLAATGIAATIGAATVAIGALTSPISLAVAAIGSLGYAVYSLTGIGDGLGDALGSEFSVFASIASTTWTGIVDAISAGDLERAVATASAGASAIWSEAVAQFNSTWSDFTTPFVETWAEITTTIAAAWVDIQAAGESALVELNAIYEGYLTGFVDTFIEFVDSVEGNWDDFVTGIQDALEGFASAFEDEFNFIADVAAEAFGVLGDIGGSVLESLVGWANDLATGLGDIGEALGLLDRQAVANANRKAEKELAAIEANRQAEQAAIQDIADARKQQRADERAAAKEQRAVSDRTDEIENAGDITKVFSQLRIIGEAAIKAANSANTSNMGNRQLSLGGISSMGMSAQFANSQSFGVQTMNIVSEQRKTTNEVTKTNGLLQDLIGAVSRLDGLSFGGD